MNCLALILSLVPCTYQRVTGTPTNETLIPADDEIRKSSKQIDYLTGLMTMMGPFKESFMGCIKGTNVTNEDLLNYRRQFSQDNLNFLFCSKVSLVNTLFNKEATDALKERFQIVRFRNGEFESINQRNVYLKYIRSQVTSDDAQFRGKDFLKGIYLHNTTKFKTQWTPQIAIVVGEINLNHTRKDSFHCRIVNIKDHDTYLHNIEFGSDEGPEGDGVLIPKMFGTYVDYFSITEKQNNLYKIEPPVKVFQPDVKLILMMHNPATAASVDALHNLLKKMCTLKYVKIFHILYDQIVDRYHQWINNIYHVHNIYRPFSPLTSSLIVFRGKGIIYEHFHINCTTDEHLKLKLREWKNTISFLKSHQIIAFQMRVKPFMVLESSEKAFNEVFGIWPITLQSYSRSGFMEFPNLKSYNSTYGEKIFILIGFRELSYSQHSSHSEKLERQLEDTETSPKKARYE